MDLLRLLDRKKFLFESDIRNIEEELNTKIKQSSFLVLGGAGSIGREVSKQLF